MRPFFLVIALVIALGGLSATPTAAAGVCEDVVGDKFVHTCNWTLGVVEYGTCYAIGWFCESPT